VLREAQNLPAYFFSDVFSSLGLPGQSRATVASHLFLLGKVRPGFTREQAEQSLATVKLDVPAILRQFIVNDRPVSRAWAR